MALPAPSSVAEFVERVLFYCAVNQASVTSYARSVKHNASVGGVEHSAHLVGLAVDVVYDAPPALDVRREYAARLGLRLIVESSHDHLQPASWPAG